MPRVSGFDRLLNVLAMIPSGSQPQVQQVAGAGLMPIDRFSSHKGASQPDR